MTSRRFTSTDRDGGVVELLRATHDEAPSETYPEGASVALRRSWRTTAELELWQRHPDLILVLPLPIRVSHARLLVSLEEEKLSDTLSSVDLGGKRCRI